jgi:hypothetical protein
VTITNGHPITVEGLAKAKGLTAKFLRDLGLKDDRRGVQIPYYDLAGDEIASKARTALIAKDGSRWPAGMSTVAYGEWRLAEAWKAGTLLVVEGESDCWALWFHGQPALGIPGSGATKCLTVEHLVGIQKLYVSREPGTGGEVFVKGIIGRLRALNFTGQAFELSMSAGMKDPADLHLQCQDGTFLDSLHERMDVAPQIWPDKQAGPGSVEPPKEKKDEESTPVIKPMAAITLLRTDWLWLHRVPRGALTILDGDPGLGKSTITTDLAARVSRGWNRPPGGGPAEGSKPAGVILLSAEDDNSRTIRPRLEAAGADLNRVHIFEGIRKDDETTPPVLPWDLGFRESAIKEHEVAVVIIDPFLAFLDSGLDAHKDQRVLHKMKQLAEDTGVSMVLIRHLNKLTGGSAMYRGGGSIGITGAARSAMLVGRHPDEPSKCVLASVKSNLGPIPKALTYSVEPVESSTGNIGPSPGGASAT